MNSSQKARLFAVLAWTGGCVLVWLLWVAASVSQPQDPGVSADVHATAVGVVATCGTGCVGSVWLAGLGVAAVIYALVRR